MTLIILILLLFINCSRAENNYPKCCEIDSVLKKNNSSYNCVEDLDRRTQIITRTNFIGRSEDGFCVDVENTTLSLFKLNATAVIKVTDMKVDFFPKCCPLNYFYNRTDHGCVRSKKKGEFRESFLKIGLPHCKIIEDLETKSHLDLNTSFEVFKWKYHEGSYCLDSDDKNLLVVRICHDDFDVCDRIRCIRKCCQDGQSFINGSFCHNTFTYGLDVSAYSDRVENVKDKFAIVHDGFIRPHYPLLSRFNYYLDTEGTFHMTEMDESLGKINITRSYKVYEKIYCVEHAQKGTINDYLFFRGFAGPQKQMKFVYTGTAMAISCVFLILTILYYAFSNAKKSLFGKILISYCTSSLLSFLLLSFFALNNTRPEKGSLFCIMSSFILFYLTLSSFTWMNVMCVDIFCTFGSSKSFSNRQYRSKELKRFLLYSLHGWGTPLLLTLAPVIFYNVDISFSIKVIINEDKCFFYRGDGNYAFFLFSTVPLTIMQICNLILFIKTSTYCLKVKREINKMNDTHVMKGERKHNLNKYRDRFSLLLKLFFVMGISFLFEVVSTFYDFKRHGDTMAIVELVWDTFNSLTGVFIFLIFILKKRIFSKFEKKVALRKLRKISLVSSGPTLTTSLPTSH